MKAREILRGINKKMTKAEIMAEVKRAEGELELFDIAEVAAMLEQPIQNMRMRAKNNRIGTLVGSVAKVYSRADIEELRRLIGGGSRPETEALRGRMIALQKKGMNKRQIAEALGVHPSYVTKLGV